MRVRFDDDDRDWEERFRAPKSLKVCNVTGKRMEFVESKAAAIAKLMRTRNRYPFIAHYWCKHCKSFHVGHEIGAERKRTDLIESIGK